MLVPASVSVCSNVNSFAVPRNFIISGDPVELVGHLNDYICRLSDVACANMTDRFTDVIQDLENLKYEGEKEQLARSIERKLHVWLKQIPSFGFNSEKFDINVIRKYLFPHLLAKKIAVREILKNTGTTCPLQPNIRCFSTSKITWQRERALTNWSSHMTSNSEKDFFHANGSRPWKSLIRPTCRRNKGFGRP